MILRVTNHRQCRSCLSKTYSYKTHAYNSARGQVGVEIRFVGSLLKMGQQNYSTCRALTVWFIDPFVANSPYLSCRWVEKFKGESKDNIRPMCNSMVNFIHHEITHTYIMQWTCIMYYDMTRHTNDTVKHCSITVIFLFRPSVCL